MFFFLSLFHSTYMKGHYKKVPEVLETTVRIVVAWMFPHVAPDLSLYQELFIPERKGYFGWDNVWRVSLSTMLSYKLEKSNWMQQMMIEGNSGKAT